MYSYDDFLVDFGSKVPHKLFRGYNYTLVSPYTKIYCLRTEKLRLNEKLSITCFLGQTYAIFNPSIHYLDNQNNYGRTVCIVNCVESREDVERILNQLTKIESWALHWIVTDE